MGIFYNGGWLNKGGWHMKRQTENILIAVIVGLTLIVTGIGLRTEVKTVANNLRSAQDKVLKIGLIVPLSGDAKAFGNSTENAFKLAVEQAGGRAGEFRIEQFTADDQNDARKAQKAADRLISKDKVQCIVGSVNSLPSIAISESANRAGVVQISGTASDSQLTLENGRRKSTIFRACFDDSTQGRGGARFALKNLKAQTAAVMFDEGSSSSRQMAIAFKKAFTAGGGSVVFFKGYAEDQIDFTSLLHQFAGKDVNLIYLPDNYQRASLASSQARNQGMDTVFLGGDNWDSPYLEYKVMEGNYFTTHCPPADQRSAMRNFEKIYKQKYGMEPDSVAVLAYDAANLLIDAVKKADSNDPGKIGEALASTRRFPGVSSEITINKNGNPIKEMPVIKIKNGQRSLAAYIRE